jgi:glycosyltransferase involved in cell wall biosynthesis
MTSAVSFINLMRGQLEFLRDEGIELDLYSGGPDEDLRELKNQRVGRVTYVPFRRQPSLFWDSVCLAWLVILFAVRRYDATVYSTPKAMFIGSIAAALTGQRHRIAWARGRAYENDSGRKRKLYLALDRLTFRASHEVLFVSPSLIEAYAADGLHLSSKGRVVGYGSSNGVDLDRFHPLPETARTALRAELGLSEHDFVIVVVGRIREDKGAREILDLSRRLGDIPNLRILMVGRSEEESLRSEVERRRDRLRTFAPSREVERFFQVADLHLLLSHREGFGNVAIEAAAAGVPTFAFDVVGVRNSVIEGATGRLFPFKDLDAIEQAIRTSAAHPTSLRQTYSKARDVVGERFSQTRVWKDYARVFTGERPQPDSNVAR